MSTGLDDYPRSTFGGSYRLSGRLRTPIPFTTHQKIRMPHHQHIEGGHRRLSRRLHSISRPRSPKICIEAMDGSVDEQGPSVVLAHPLGSRLVLHLPFEDVKCTQDS